MLGLFRRKAKLAPERRPPLEPEERIVGWAENAGGEVLVATNRGLFLPGLRRIGWHEIHKVTWSGRELAVTSARVVEEREAYAVVADEPVVSHLLLQPRDLPPQVRTRVTRSVAYTRHHPFDPGGGVRVVARRVSGVNGLTWTVRYDPGTPTGDAEVIAGTRRLLAEAWVAAAPVP